ncbi:MAG: UvrD-helicase domain-containing protein [Clostridiaceae bacterium]|nr:UvrD-helicase domain-containing protein [Clostridiaceae bacterium]
MDLKKELNNEQYLAATHVEGPLLILAGAGSGKTRVITYRIAHLIKNCGVSPYNILAITFTNKAAREMAERASFLLGEENLYGIWINTFHAACGKILRRYADRIGFSSNFIIYDESEVQVVLKECLRRLNIDEKYLDARAVRNYISRAKDEMISWKDFTKTYNTYNNHMYRMVADVYKMYQETLLANNAMDFDDMILMTIKLFKENPDVLEYYQEKFKFIMVDEYQDTNMAQYEFVRLLASKYKNLCVVGDDDQSIYGFRGADIRNILEFENEYHDCKVIKLEQNYRSTQNILDAANKIIRNNTERRSKRLWTEQGRGEPITRYEADDHNDEALYIVSAIQDGVRNGMKYSDFTILYRINALSQTIEKALSRFGIPYRVYGGLKFFDRKEIKDIVCYLRVLDNPLDDVALRRIINVPKRGIGDVSYNHAYDIAMREGTNVLNVFLNAGNYSELSRTATKLTSFALKIMDMMMKKDSMGISEYVKYVIYESGMIDELKRENTDEAESRIENLMEFISVANEYENEIQESPEAESLNNLTSFLQTIALSTDMDRQENEDADMVTLMTIHNSKGLEFPVVFVIAMEEGTFPSMRAELPEEVEEERRLCYVAITRAMKKLYLTHSRLRLLYGRTNYRVPSRFLRELEIGAENEKDKSEKSTNFRTGAVRKGAFGRVVNSVGDVKALNQKTETVSANDFKVGDRVKHKKFGNGTIVKMEGSGDKTIVEIQFDSTGMKRLMLAYAKLSHI